ncbi:wax ester/triacylglycerol synthase domain-containing protein [Nocardia takedensis]
MPHTNVSMVAMHILGQAPDRERLTEQLRRVSEVAGRFRQRVRPSLLGDILPPTWVTVEDFDVTDHIHWRALPENGGFDALAGAIDAYQNEPWDMGAPLWSVTVFTGLDGGGAASVIKVHHCMSDGSAFIMMLAATSTFGGSQDQFGTVTRAAEPSVWRTTLTTAFSLGRRGFREVARHLPALRDSAERRRVAAAVREIAHRGEYGAARARSTRRSCLLEVPTAVWKNAAAARGGGVNDLLVAVSAETWRRYYTGERNTDGVRIAMPVARRAGDGDDDGGNRYGNATLTVDLREGAVRDLGPVRETARRARAEVLEQRRGLADSFPQLLPGRIRAGLAFRRGGWNDVGTTNLAAPFDCEVAGVLVEGFYILSCPMGQPFGFGLMGYRGRIHLTMNADEGFVHRWEDLVKALHSTLLDVGIEAELHHGPSTAEAPLSDRR